MDIKNIKKEFPIFKQKINGKPLVYLDSANSSQKPKVVIDKISSFYETEYSNVGRSVHTLAVKATNRFEATRDKIQKYLNAKHREEIIFTKGATEAINLVASSYGKKYIKEGDEVLITELEIYADDVKCSHGSTSGSIDLDSIHYLKSRGIPEKKAFQMLINGFLSEILENLPEDNLKKFLLEKIGRQINGY